MMLRLKNIFLTEQQLPLALVLFLLFLVGEVHEEHGAILLC